MDKKIWEASIKICHFSPSSCLPKQNRLGIVLNEKDILDINLYWSYHFFHKEFYNYQDRANHFAPPSLAQILKLKSEPLSFFQETLEKYNQYQIPESVFTYKESKINPPLDAITTYRDFYSHEKHVAKGFELRKEKIPESWYEIPAYYKGNPHSFIGPEDDILWPHYTERLDYELELAAIIGRDGYNLTEKKAEEHIFGLTILNDISARDTQKKEMSIRLGPAKAKDFCSIIGPVITTIDEFESTNPNLTMIARVNGEEWSRGQSGDAHYSFAQMIAYVSQNEWVLSGDLMGSGTVGTGCGLELSRWIQEGDRVELEIEGIGTLCNKVGKQWKI